MTRRVMLADDDVLLREGLASLLERADFEVVGQAGSGDELVAMVRKDAPDVVVVDIRMPPTHTSEGLDAARVVREEFPDTAILVLSAHVDVEHSWSSWCRSSGSAGAGRSWTQRWCRSSWTPDDATTHSPP
jgi:DNA-binding NarL/FixJ family response regulator